MKTKEQKIQELKEWLHKKQVEMFNRRGRIVSVSEMAREANIPQPTLNGWFNGARLPEGDNVHALAAYFDQGVYEILEIAPPLPTDPILRRIAMAWPSLSQEAQKKILDIIKE